MNMQMAFPMKRYLKKYFYWRENIPYNTIIDFTVYENREVCMVMSKLMEGKMTFNGSGSTNSDASEQYNDHVPISFTITQFKHNKIFVSAQAIRFFNTYLQRNLHEMLVQRILAVRNYGVSEADVIHQFMADLDLLDDISFDALKKGSYRLRSEKNLPIFRLAPSPAPK
jgi:hypothetical protein